MSQNKKYTAKEAAFAVLKKAHELLVKSEAEKQPGKGLVAEEKDQTPKEGVHKDNPDAQPREGNGPQSLGEKVNAVVAEHLAQHGEGEKVEEGSMAGHKGHIKLAHFMGRIQAKRDSKNAKPEQDVQGEQLKKAEKKMAYHTSYGVKDMGQKGVNHQTARGVPGVSTAGGAIRRGKLSEAKTIHKEKLKSLKAMPKPNLTKKETGHEKGVHKPVYESGEQGTSKAGLAVKTKSRHGQTEMSAYAKGVHKHKLAELKAMPKPNLTKGQNDGKHAANHTNNYDDHMAVKGVNKVVPVFNSSKKAVEHGNSEGGLPAKRAHGPSKAAIRHHTNTLNELKAMPKPKLTKDEDMDGDE